MSRREYLSVEDHRKVAAEIEGIEKAHSRILALINGKVPAKILDQLLTWRGVDKSLNKLRSDLEDEFERRHPDKWNVEIYYPRHGVD